MSRGDITRISSTVDEHLPLSSFQRLHHDLRIIPRAATRAEREEHCFTTRQNLRSMGGFTLRIHTDQKFFLATVGRHLKDALCALSKDNPVIGSPTGTPRIHCIAQFHRCPPGDSNFLQITCIKSYPLSVRRKEWASASSLCGATDGCGF